MPVAVPTGTQRCGERARLLQGARGSDTFAAARPPHVPSQLLRLAAAAVSHCRRCRRPVAACAAKWPRVRHGPAHCLQLAQSTRMAWLERWRPHHRSHGRWRPHPRSLARAYRAAAPPPCAPAHALRTTTRRRARRFMRCALRDSKRARCKREAAAGAATTRDRRDRRACCRAPPPAHSRPKLHPTSRGAGPRACSHSEATKLRATLARWQRPISRRRCGPAMRRVLGGV